MEMELSQNFSSQGGAGPLTIHRRSDRCYLLSESINADCARITAYERLSESVKLGVATNTACFGQESASQNKALLFVGKIFGNGKTSASASASDSTSDDDKSQPQMVAPPPENKAKKPSSWLPDPDRRWPVQGW